MIFWCFFPSVLGMFMQDNSVQVCFRGLSRVISRDQRMSRVKDQDEEGRDQEDPGTKGPKDQKTRGPEDQGTKGAGKN